MPVIRFLSAASYAFLCALLFATGCGKSESDTATGNSRPAQSSVSDTQGSSGFESEAAQDETPSRSDALVNRSREDLIKRFASLKAAGQEEAAVEVLNVMLVQDPKDHEALFQLAGHYADTEQVGQAIEMLAGIPRDAPKVGAAAGRFAVTLLLRQQRYDEAEDRLNQLLEDQATASFARLELATLLNRQGRRHEANRFARQNCLTGNLPLEQLRGLLFESDAVYPPKTKSSSGTKGAPGDPKAIYSIGRGGKARFLWTHSYFEEAAEQLEESVADGTAVDSHVALYGAAIAESQQDDKLVRWLDTTSESTQVFPEYWSALGTYLLSQSEFEPAVRCFAESISRDPTDLRSMRRMIKSLRSVGDDDAAEKWDARYRMLAKTLDARPVDSLGNPTGVTSVATLSKQLSALGRDLEALHWEIVQVMQSGSASSESRARLQAMSRRGQQIVQSGAPFGTKEEVLCGLDLDRFPLPDLSAVSTQRSRLPAEIKLADPTVAATFSNVTESIGLRHTFRVSDTAREMAFAIYETFGGGVAAIDYDLNGYPDLYFCQGHAKGPDFNAMSSDQLYRNQSAIDKPAIADVTDSARLTENAYTLGVTAGDWNQDGFPDLVVTNIGPDVLLINQGDGTFRREVLNPNDSRHRLSTSVAMGDLNGDRLPDLFCLGYLDDSSISKRPPLDAQGRPKATVNPLSFRPSLDGVYWNDGSGGWKREQVGRAGDESTGLGVVLCDLNPTRPGNEVFVANDERADQLWSFASDEGRWNEYARIVGCAFGSLGFPVGSMGVAAADFDRNGTLDLHVTTFFGEPSCHFLSTGSLYVDKNVRFGLDRESSSYLGFGAQAVDYANRGALDLVVLNGFVEDLQHTGRPFRQPTQLLANHGAKYRSVPVNDDSGYWNGNHLGRSLAKLDFDRDGKQDLVATDMIEPSVLLLNETESTNHWIGLELVGTASERDAVGAKVTMRSGEQTWTNWVTAGDGYLCKNDHVLHFGLGKSTSIDSIEVDWPTGENQTVVNPVVDVVNLVIEDVAESFVVGR